MAGEASRFRCCKESVTLPGKDCNRTKHVRPSATHRAPVLRWVDDTLGGAWRRHTKGGHPATRQANAWSGAAKLPWVLAAYMQSHKPAIRPCIQQVHTHDTLTRTPRMHTPHEHAQAPPSPQRNPMPNILNVRRDDMDHNRAHLDAKGVCSLMQRLWVPRHNAQYTNTQYTQTHTLSQRRSRCTVRKGTGYQFLTLCRSSRPRVAEAGPIPSSKKRKARKSVVHNKTRTNTPGRPSTQKQRTFSSSSTNLRSWALN